MTSGSDGEMAIVFENRERLSVSVLRGNHDARTLKRRAMVISFSVWAKHSVATWTWGIGCDSCNDCLCLFLYLYLDLYLYLYLYLYLGPYFPCPCPCPGLGPGRGRGRGHHICLYLDIDPCCYLCCHVFRCFAAWDILVPSVPRCHSCSNDRHQGRTSSGWGIPENRN